MTPEHEEERAIPGRASEASSLAWRKASTKRLQQPKHPLVQVCDPMQGAEVKSGLLGGKTAGESLRGRVRLALSVGMSTWERLGFGVLGGRVVRHWLTVVSHSSVSNSSPLDEAVEAVLVGHVGGDLRGGEGVGQIEEQLEQSRPVFLVRGASAAQSTDAAPFLAVARPR